MNTPSILDGTSDTITHIAEKTADKANSAIDATRQATTQTLDRMQSRVGGLRESVPAAVSRAAAETEALARRGAERAREARDALRARASDMGDQSVAYVRAQPVKAMVYAVAAGALAAVLLGWASRSDRSRA